MKAATLEWLKAGDFDLKTMEKLLNDEFLTCMVAFHAQQLTEKTFKALFEEKNIDVPKIHSLVTLWKRIAPCWEEFPLLKEDILYRLDQLMLAILGILTYCRMVRPVLRMPLNSINFPVDSMR